MNKNHMTSEVYFEESFPCDFRLPKGKIIYNGIYFKMIEVIINKNWIYFYLKVRERNSFV